MYDITIPMTVRSIEPNQKIILDWDDHNDKTTVEWTFTNLGEKGTFVNIVNSGFKGGPDEILAQVRDSTEGFTIVLAGLKALLEDDIQLNLVVDRFPKEIGEHRFDEETWTKMKKLNFLVQVRSLLGMDAPVEQRT